MVNMFNIAGLARKRVVEVSDFCDRAFSIPLLRTKTDVMSSTTNRSNRAEKGIDDTKGKAAVARLN